ncbi:SDR family NAD(P)-dependent oxidoreductase [Bacillus sp. 165]|uniref:SDR family oxidoreductase n=1 Tax=Bacillus sp. 165 TaxID=1529117 RepID=UPI001ADBBF74|nr:SDR family NAD(P)-dependent oxidoreductase [Bacillus sp. 165]MBO9130529.1 SDR family NAD(P)-dependent oxidoreductase [Bacillus sp. 165]
MLQNQVAIVTGATRGIGKSIAMRLAEQGMKLSLWGSSDEIHSVGQELKEKGYTMIETIQADVSNEQDVQAAVEKTVEVFGTIDVLVNNAGIGFFKLVEDTNLEEWKRVFEVNVQGVFLCSKAVLPYLKEKRGGSIITVSSDVGRYTIANGGAYTATKYAVQGFCGSLAQEMREYNVRVGTINPGMVDTYFAGGTQGAAGKETMIQADDIANAVIYMASAPGNITIDQIVIHPFMQTYPVI